MLQFFCYHRLPELWVLHNEKKAPNAHAGIANKALLANSKYVSQSIFERNRTLRTVIYRRNKISLPCSRKLDITYY